MGSVNHAEVSFGAGLAGVAVVHVTGVVQLAAPITRAEEVWIGESVGAGIMQAGIVRRGFP